MSLSTSLVAYETLNLVPVNTKSGNTDTITLWPAYLLNCQTDNSRIKNGTDTLEQMITSEESRRVELENMDLNSIEEGLQDWIRSDHTRLYFFKKLKQSGEFNINEAVKFLEGLNNRPQVVKTKPISKLAARKHKAEAKLQSWKNMPLKELQTRLNKGEILPVDEWMPNSDKKKPLLDQEVGAHLEFATRLKTEGNQAYAEYIKTHAEGELDTADLRYTQGIRLLESVEADPSSLKADELNWEIDDMYKCFLRNCAQTSLLRNRADLCIKYSDILLNYDIFDVKGRYRRAMAYLNESLILECKNDLQFLRTKEGFEDVTVARAAGNAGLKALRKILISWREDARKMLDASATAEVFSTSRPETMDNDTPKTQTQSNPIIEQKKLLNILERENVIYIENKILISVMEAVKGYMAQQHVLDQINNIKMRCDFDPKKYITLLRKEILGSLHQFIYDKLVLFSNDDTSIKAKTVKEVVELYEKSIKYHMAKEKYEGLTSTSDIETEYIPDGVTILFRNINELIWEFVD